MTLTNNEAMNVIGKAIAELKQELGVDLAHHFTSVGKNGYATDIMDRDAKDALFDNKVANWHDESIFNVEFYYSLFDSTLDPQLDQLAGVLASDNINTMAIKRCKYIIRKAYEQFKKELKIITKDFLVAEVKQIIEELNRVKKLQIAIIAWQSEGQLIKIFITDTHVDQNGPDANTYTYIDPEYYIEEDTTLDNLLGIQFIKHGKEYWKYNGHLRIAYLIFTTIKTWLKNKHKDVYQQLK